MKAPGATFASELWADIRSPRLIPIISAGLIAGLGLLVAQIAFGGFIFSGHLAPYFSQGVGLILFGNFASCLLIALWSGYRGAISGLPAAPMAVMVLIGAEMVAESDRLFISTVAALIVSAAAAGLCCLLIARFRLAELLRFIPFPVAAGVVAGTGSVVWLAAMSLMGATLDWEAPAAILEASALWQWGPGATFGLALFVAMKRWRNPLLMPAAVVLAGALFHLTLFLLEFSGEEARAAGLLFAGAADGTLWPAYQLGDIVLVDWVAVARQIPGMLTLVVVSLIYLVMNLAAIELAANQELDWNHEIRSAGAASVIAGLGGGTVGCLIVPPSLRNKMLDAASRLTGIIAALVVGAALFVGETMLEWVPVPVVGGILVFTGLGMIDEGLVKSRARMSWAEFFVVLLMFAAITGFGFLEGVGAGLLATLVFFAAHLSRVDQVTDRFTLAERRSSKVRNVPERALLRAAGSRVQGVRLRGYIFFGSAVPLASGLRATIGTEPPPVCILLDFEEVSGFDSSAVSVLCKFFRSAWSEDVRVVISSADSRFRNAVRRGLPPAAFSSLLFELNEDQALERCEEMIIAARKADAGKKGALRSWLLERSAEGLERHLERQIAFESVMEDLEPWLTTREYAANETIAGPGETGDGLRLLQSGRISAYDSAGTRLYQRGPGEALWAMDSRDQVAATLRADETSRIVELAVDAQSWLEENEERRILRLYRYLIDSRKLNRIPAEQPAKAGQPGTGVARRGRAR